MGKRALAVLMAMVLGVVSLGAFGISAMSPASASAAGTHYVSPWGNDASGQGTEDSPWRTIGYAVSRAAAGDSVKLMDDDNEATDDYVEDVVLEKSLTIRRYNNSGPNPQVRGLGGDRPVFHVAADDATVAGLDIYAIPVDRNGFPYSIELAGCHRCKVENCRLGWDLNHLAGGACAVDIKGGGKNEICGNVSRYYGMYGARVSGSDSNIISYNVFSNSRFVWGAGIWLHSSPSNTVVGNTLSQNLSWGLVVYLDSPHNVIYLNRIFDNAEDGCNPSCAGSTWHSPEPLTYIYEGATYTGYLGNYHGRWYVDDGQNGGTAGDGVGDDQPCSEDCGQYCYPLVDGSPEAYRLLNEETSPPAPVASFSASVTSGVAPFTATFTNQSRGGELTSWQWDFGDGHTSSFENPSHTYETAGEYAVSLTVTNISGSHSITMERYITVTDDPAGRTAPTDNDSPVQIEEGTIVPMSIEEAATGTAFVIRLPPPDGAPAITGYLQVRVASGSAASPRTLVCCFSGTFFTVGGAEAPDGLASIRVPYSDADLEAAGGDPDRLTLSYYDEVRGQWVIVDTAADAGTRTLTANTTHPGKWAIMAKPAPAAKASASDMWHWALAGAAALVLMIMILVAFRHRLITR